MTRIIINSLTCLCTLLLVPSVQAHHSFASEFDQNRPIILEGVVKRMSFANPHSQIYLTVTKEDGTVEDWAIGGTSPNALLRRGWSRKSLPEGTRIIVKGFQARDRSNRAYGGDITLPDGTTLFMGTSGFGGPNEGQAGNTEGSELVE